MRPCPRRLAAAAVAALLLPALVHSATAAAPARKRTHASRRAPSPPALVWEVETMDGKVLDSHLPDQPINPASVTKVATTWWALEKLGPDHRFTTRIYARGTIDRARGLLTGDLVVRGDADPDFQAENAFLVAAALNDKGIRKVTGSVIVDGRFWMGWENGSEGTIRDTGRRETMMAGRLRRALDVRRWTRATRASWIKFAGRRGLSSHRPPNVRILGGARYEPSPESSTLLFEHVSKPLVETLRRFNCYSNNDIERVAVSIGPMSELAVLLADRLAPAQTPVRIETASGLGENRLSPRQIVAMLKAFRASAEKLGLAVTSLLPVAGCDPGTVTASFPKLSSEPYATSLVAKTGTLTSTDGGITVLAGFLNTAQGEIVFCIASPHAGGRIHLARHAEERFVLGLLDRLGGARPRTCGPPLAMPDTDATIVGTSLAATPGAVPASTR